jgi:hypothetical protein
MTVLASSADPAYQMGYAAGQILFSVFLTLAFAYESWGTVEQQPTRDAARIGYDGGSQPWQQ